MEYIFGTDGGIDITAQILWPQSIPLLREKYKDHIQKTEQKVYNWNLEVDDEYFKKYL